MTTDAEPPSPPARRQKLTSEAARALGRKGGHAKANKRKLMDSLGLLRLDRESSFGPYRDAADAWLRAALSECHKAFDGVDGAASTMLASAALQLAASRWAFALGASCADVEIVKVASLLANHSRANHLAAIDHLTAARERTKGDGPGSSPRGVTLSLEQALGAP